MVDITVTPAFRRVLCNNTACTDRVLDGVAQGGEDSSATCRSRISWLMRQGVPQLTACTVVGKHEFPYECGACASSHVTSSLSTLSYNAPKMLGVLQHYHHYQLPTERPTADQLDAARIRYRGGSSSGEASSALEARHVVLAVLGSCSLPERLRHADMTWCSDRHPGGDCFAYVDCELDELPHSLRLRHIRIVPLSAYANASVHSPRAQCCNPKISYTDHALYDGYGPSTFYCDSNGSNGRHRHQTLAAQYRFLPALDHAKRSHLAAFRAAVRTPNGREPLLQVAHEARWLVLVDDDSWVSVPRLLETLGGYDPRAKVQLGEFTPSLMVNTTHWKRPFACGGAGTVVSAMAVIQVDFEKCLRRFNDTCQQSDWMIGRCLESHDVLAVTQSSCGACARPLNKLRHVAPLAQALQSGRCSFLQMTTHLPTTPRVGNGFSLPVTWAAYALSVPAIVHTLQPIWSFLDFDCVGEEEDDQQASRSNGSLPRLLIVGAQKSATTSVWNKLVERDRVFCESRTHSDDPFYYTKEKHFFGTNRCSRGIKFYRSYFPADPACSYVDATPYIGEPRGSGNQGAKLFTATVPLQVFYTFPLRDLSTLRLVAMLREPVDRTISWYHHLLAHGPECKSGCEHYTCCIFWRCARLQKGVLTDASGTKLCHPEIDSLDERCYSVPSDEDKPLPFLAFVGLMPWQVESSIYAPQLLQWRRYFGARLLVVPYEEFQANSHLVMRRIADHAQVSLRSDYVPQLHRDRFLMRSNRTSAGSCQEKRRQISCDFRQRLNAWFEPHNQLLFGFEPGLRDWLLPDECCR